MMFFLLLSLNSGFLLFYSCFEVDFSLDVTVDDIYNSVNIARIV